MNTKPPIPFDNSFSRLPDQFFSHQAPSPVTSPRLIRINTALAQQLGIDAGWLASDEGLQMLAGNTLPEQATPIATVYAGHQFGNWNPQLGDGRAILLGELKLPENGLRYDIQLKGAGQTPYSRMGDGRSPIGPVLREYIVSEAMTALGIPSTRSLAAVTTGENVVRDRLLPGGILTRVAQSHIRIGTFQYFAARQNTAAVKTLADYIIKRHYPDVAQAENPYFAFLEAVISRQAQLIALWQSVGFIHGVMNTDNMLLCGETVDYGPCAFMDTFDPATVFSSIDRDGRYAYGNQPAIAQWNLSWLAQSLLPLLMEDEKQALELAQSALNGFSETYQHHYDEAMCHKLGLSQANPVNRMLLQNLLDLMTKEQCDFTLCFRFLAENLVPDQAHSPGISDFFQLPTAFKPWLEQWRHQVSKENPNLAAVQADLLAANPAFIPRNHLLEEVIESATTHNDFSPFHSLVDLLEKPFEYRPEHMPYAQPPRPEQVVENTFCGT
jgi:uncharacterized protein YdiU (UPF0061 family)